MSMDMNLSKLQEIVKDRGAWCAAVHGFAKSQIGLSNGTTYLKTGGPVKEFKQPSSVFIVF